VGNEEIPRAYRAARMVILAGTTALVVTAIVGVLVAGIPQKLLGWLGAVQSWSREVWKIVG
jgi:hypothetical protein